MPGRYFVLCKHDLALLWASNLCLFHCTGFHHGVSHFIYPTCNGQEDLLDQNTCVYWTEYVKSTAQYLIQCNVQVWPWVTRFNIHGTGQCGLLELHNSNNEQLKTVNRHPQRVKIKLLILFSSTPPLPPCDYSELCVFSWKRTLLLLEGQSKARTKLKPLSWLKNNGRVGASAG